MIFHYNQNNRIIIGVGRNFTFDKKKNLFFKPLSKWQSTLISIDIFITIQLYAIYKSTEL